MIEKDTLKVKVRSFVSGASWWEFYSNGSMLDDRDRRLVEKEAERRYATQPVSGFDRAITAAHCDRCGSTNLELDGTCIDC